jgi:hypothetical protein
LKNTSGAGTIVEPDGRVSINNPQTKSMVAFDRDGVSYNKVSMDFFQTTNEILSGQVSVDDGIKATEAKINRVLH